MKVEMNERGLNLQYSSWCAECSGERMSMCFGDGDPSKSALASAGASLGKLQASSSRLQ
jgi:hypothetical protein